MYKILIIEDEQIERETLYKILHDNFTIKGLYMAKNGKEALDVFEREKPEIVLADINIPGINGLEVIRRIKQQQQDTSFLVLSSYNYFEYAQEAIRLGVSDFILKPYNIEHLKEVVDRLIHQHREKRKEQQQHDELLEKIEKITPVVENECLYAIISNENELELKRSLRLLSPHICSGFCMIMQSLTCAFHTTAMDTICENFKKQGYRCIKELFHGLQIFFILFERPIDQQEVRQLAGYIDGLRSEYKDVVIGIGPIVCELIKFHHSFDLARDRLSAQAQPALKLLMEDEKSSEENAVNIATQVEVFMKAFQKMDEESLKKHLNQLSLQLIQEEKEQLYKDVSELITSLKNSCEKQYPEIDFTKVKITPLRVTSSIHQEVPLYLHMQIHRLYDLIAEEKFRNTNLLVRHAIRYIDSNYRKQITLSDMADALQVSPYYISKLLSSSLNKTFTELVSERRVEASKELLKTNKRIKEIAYEVGFQGQNYFTKVFKNYTGVTPKVYKNTFENKE